MTNERDIQIRCEFHCQYRDSDKRNCKLRSVEQKFRNINISKNFLIGKKYEMDQTMQLFSLEKNSILSIQLKYDSTIKIYFFF